MLTNLTFFIFGLDELDLISYYLDCDSAMLGGIAFFLFHQLVVLQLAQIASTPFSCFPKTSQFRPKKKKTRQFAEGAQNRWQHPWPLVSCTRVRTSQRLEWVVNPPPRPKKKKHINLQLRLWRSGYPASYKRLHRWSQVRLLWGGASLISLPQVCVFMTKKGQLPSPQQKKRNTSISDQKKNVNSFI